MPQEAKDIDELESLLAGLSDAELDQLGDLDEPVAAAATTTVIDDDIADAELIGDLDEPAPTAAVAPPRRKRRLKPLDPEPAVKTVAAPPAEDDLESLLELDEAEPVVAPANSPAKMDAARLEEFALEVIDLMTNLGQTFSLEDDRVNNLVAPVLTKITETSTLKEVEQQMTEILQRNHLQTELGDTPFEPEEVAPVNFVEKLEEVMKPVAERIAAENADPLGDAELEALLAAVPADPTPAPVTPTPTKPVAVTPTRKAGALNTFIDADKLQDDLGFTENNISLAMTRQAALFAHYARLSADATYQSDRAKQQVELLEAQLNQKFRDGMVASGTKFTEKSIDAMVISDTSYQAAQERAHEARAIAKMVESATESFRHRKDMLIQVGADLRMEKQGELRMKEHPGQRAVGAM